MSSWWCCSEREFVKRLPIEQARMARESLDPGVAHYLKLVENSAARRNADEGMRGYFAGAHADDDPRHR